MLEKAPLPKDVIALGVEEIRKIWHDKRMRGRGITEDRAKTLVEAAHNRLVWMEELEQKVSYICCLRNIDYGLHN